MADVKRENGYYWVKYYSIDEWEVMRWDGCQWDDTDGFAHDDDEVDEIDERRITRD